MSRLKGKQGVLVDKKVLYQVLEGKQGLELLLFYETRNSLPIYVTESQLQDPEWMEYKALAFMQKVESVPELA